MQSRHSVSRTRGKKPRARNASGKNASVRNAASVQPESLEPRRLMAAVLWMENFDGLAYGPNREETEHPADHVWTNVPPTGWVKDDTQVPGYNNPDLPPPPLPDPPPDPLPGPGNEDNNGVTEWIGWTFANRDW